MALLATGMLILASPAVFAADQTYTGGDATGATSTGLASGDTLFLSGSSGTLDLFDGISLNVTDWVQMGKGPITLSTKNNITIQPLTDSNDGWAVVEMSGSPTTRVLDIQPTSATTATLNLHKIVLAGGSITSYAGGLIIRGSASGNLIINGDVVFLNNLAAGSTGGAISWASTAAFDLTFTGTAIFERNGARNAAENLPGGAIGPQTGGSSATGGSYTFQKTAMFFSNTAGAQGGAIYGAVGCNMFFYDAAIFKNNTAINNRGGAIAASTNAAYAGAQIIKFSGNVEFDSNRSLNNEGGAIAATDGIILVFDGTTVPNGASTVSFTNNFASARGGAITSGTIEFTGGEFLVKNNFSGNTGADGNTPSTTVVGGAIRALSLEVNGNYDVSGNQTLGSGGGVSTSALYLNGSGTMSENMAYANGGAINAPGNGIFEIRSDAMFVDNVAGGSGGAIHVADTSMLALNADAGDIVFNGNRSGVTIDYSAVASGGKLTVTPGSGTANAIHFAAASATLALNAESGRLIRFDDPISSASGLPITVTKNGAGAVSFATHHSNVVANTTIEEGAFRLSQGAIYGAANDSGTFTVKSGATLAANGIVRAGDIQIENNATLMALENGLLTLDTSGAPGIGTGLTLAGSGTISMGDPETTLLSATAVRIGDPMAPASPQTLVVSNSVALADNTTLRINLYTGNQSDLFVAANGLACADTIKVDLGFVETGSFTIANWASGDVSSGQLSLSFNGGAQTNRNNAQLGVDTAARTLYVTNTVQSLALRWTGSAGDLMWRSSAVESANWTDGQAASAERYFHNGDLVTFDPEASGTITIETSGVTVSGMTVTGSENHVFQGQGGITANTSSAQGPAITATGKLLKTGAGKLVFANSATNSFSAGVDIKGGEVIVAAGGGLAGDIIIDDSAGEGAMLSGQGTFGNVTIKNGGGFNVGASSTASGTAVIDHLTLDNGMLYFDLFSNNTSDYLHVSNTTTVLAGGTITIGSFASGTFNLGNFGGIANRLTVGISGRQAGVLENGASGELLLKTVADISRVLRWQGQAGQSWDGSVASWAGDKDQSADGDRVIFDSSSDPAYREITLAEAGARVADMWVSADGYVFKGSGGIVSGTQYISDMGSDSGFSDTAATGRLWKTGTGTMEFANTGTNLFEGGILLGDSAGSGGMIRFSSPDQIRTGTAAIEFANSATLRAGEGMMGTLAGNIVIANGATATLDIPSGTLCYAGRLANLGPEATFSQTGSDSMLILVSNNGGYSGVTNIEGTLLLDNTTLGGSVNVKNGAVFGGSGTASGPGSIQVSEGGFVRIGGMESGAGTLLHIANLVMKNGSRLVGGGTLAGAMVTGTAAGDMITVRAEAGNPITIASTLAGEGVLLKEGTGDLMLSGAINIGSLDLIQGKLSLDSGDPAVVKRSLNIGTGSTLLASGRITSAAFVNSGTILVGSGTAPFGKLAISGSYAGNNGWVRLRVGGIAPSTSGYYVQSDKFEVTGGSSGITNVWFEQSAPAANALPEGITPPDDIVTGVPVSVLSEGEPGNVLYFGPQEWWFVPNQGGSGGKWESNLIASVPPLTGLDAAAALIGKASFEAVNQRLAWKRDSKSGHKFELWTSGLSRNDQIKNGLYDGAKAHTAGGQAGADWSYKNGNIHVSVGVFADYTRTEMNQPRKRSATDTKSNGIGVYESINAGPWFADMILRGSQENHTVTVPRLTDMRADGTSWAGAFTLGRVFITKKSSWRVEPQIQVVIQDYRIDDVTDYFNRNYRIASDVSLEGRATIRLMKEFKKGKHIKLIPWIRGGFLHEFKGRSTVIVDDTWSYTNGIRDSGTMIDAGISMTIGSRVSVEAGASLYDNGELRSRTFTAGCHVAW
jgi:outer membrane autotransporter protein